jgi:hypothetical protein
MANEFAEMPGPKYRVRIELYVADEPDSIILREDGPGETADDIEAAAGIVARRMQRAIVNYEANNQ